MVCIGGAPTIVWKWSQGSFPEEITFKLGPEGWVGISQVRRWRKSVPGKGKIACAKA